MSKRICLHCSGFGKIVNEKTGNFPKTCTEEETEEDMNECDTCGGTGQIYNLERNQIGKKKKKCPDCNGNGLVPAPVYIGTGSPDIEPVKPFDNSEDKEHVNHPNHYNNGNIEVIDAIDDWNLGFYEGNIVKYVARAKHKGKEVEDLKKARWYLDRLIQILKDEQ